MDVDAVGGANAVRGLRVPLGWRMSRGIRVTSEANHVSPYTMVVRPSLRLAAARPDDFGYVLGSWLEGNWKAPRMRKIPFRLYRAAIEPKMQAVLEQPETRLLAAYLDDTIVGWLAYEWRRHVDLVHWVHTRYSIGKGPTLRGKGIMRSLFAAAPLKKRLGYLHRGPVSKEATPRVSSDVWIAKWLTDRGSIVSYDEKEDWKV